ncbi:streptophobe family protein [Streptomyces orinoci]|uniref:Streptophobe family protein n=1 Tax=Streptomyces orinoci TaxID=67339 RepID=A0ABV3JRD4_STRON|nr:streptophobe family protein [Streptomyces orinoci]
MSQPPPEVRAWGYALVTVVAALAAMVVTGALGLWAAGAGHLPSGAFPGVLAATLVSAVGGTLQLTGGAGFLGRTGATVSVVPLSVTLAGALAAAACFRRGLDAGLRPTGLAVRTAVPWLAALGLITAAARHTFRLSLGGQVLNDIGEALGVTPTVGFRAAVTPTLGFGLLWLLILLGVVALASRRVALPRFLRPARPAVRAVLGLLLGYMALGLLVGVVTLITHGHPAETMAVLLLGLPNLAWLALGIGLGGAWDGQVPHTIGLPMPQALAAVLRAHDGRTATVDLSSLSEQDGRAWVLALAAALTLLLTGYAATTGPRPWRQAVWLAVSLALALLAVGALTGISARYGLSLIGLGDIDAFGSEVTLHARLLRLLGLGALWGLLSGLLCALLPHRVPPAAHTRHPPET